MPGLGAFREKCPNRRIKGMKLFRFVLSLSLLAAPCAFAQAFHAGVTSLRFHPSVQRNWRGAQIEALDCLLWYPADAHARETEQQFGPEGLPPLFHAGFAARNAVLARSLARLPLVVASHGLGGAADQFGWIGPELARHGYLVLAVNHPGNNALEPPTPEGYLLWWERATDISEVLDGILADRTFGPHVDRTRIGALGYSIGGETVLALAGARVDQQAFIDFCRAHAEEPTCRVPAVVTAGGAEKLLEAVRASSAESLARSGDSYRDARIRSVFAISPAVGQAFHRESFEYVTVPVTMVAGSEDTLAPPAVNAEQFAAWRPQAKLAVLPDAGHYVFLDSCTDEGASAAPQYCADAPSVDRDSIHRKTAGMAIAFFDRTLAPVAASSGNAAVNGGRRGPSAGLHLH